MLFILASVCAVCECWTWRVPAAANLDLAPIAALTRSDLTGPFRSPERKLAKSRSWNLLLGPQLPVGKKRSLYYHLVHR